MIQSRTAKVLVLSSGQALTSLVSFASVAILTRILSQADFGTYRQVMLAYSFAVPFVVLGLDQALFAFLPGEKERPRGLLVENLLLLTVAGGILSLFIILGGGHLLAKRFNNPALAPLLSLMILYPLFMLPSSALSGCLIACNRTEQLAAFNVVSRLFVLFIVIIPCFWLPKASTAVIGNVAGAILTTIVAVILMFNACKGPDWKPTWVGIKKQFLFSVPLGLSTIIGTTSRTLDQVLVSLRCPPEVFAVYTVGAIEIPLIGIITGSITSVALVDYVRFYKEGNTAAIVDLVHKAMTKSAILILPVMTFLFCIAPEFVRLFFGKNYEWSALPFRIYLLLLPVRTITFGAILLATGNTQKIFIMSLLGLAANLIISWYMISLFGPAGAAAGGLLAMYLVCIPYLIITIRKVLKVKASHLFPWKCLGKILMASTLPAAIILIYKSLFTTSDIYMVGLSVVFFMVFLGIGYRQMNILTVKELIAMVRPRA
jgi:O-antigen/teichoic acid export membrane protein